MRWQRIALAIVAIGAPWIGAFGAIEASAEAPGIGDPEGRVLIVSVPRLTWDTVEDFELPNFDPFFADAAVAQTSVRTAGSNTRPGDAYLTIGAGNRMGTRTDVDGDVIERTEPTLDGDATSRFSRATGIAPEADIVVPGAPTLDRFNEDLHFGGKAGALATALRSEDKSMAVIANADRKFSNPGYRQAGLAAMDEDGQVWAGMVDDELLRVNDQASYGIESDPAVIVPVFADLWADSDVVLIEMSDLERAENARSLATDEQAERQYRKALTASDELFGEILTNVDLSKDTVLVVGPTAPLEQTQLTVFAMAGPGIEPGWATSSTTRRGGYITLTDIAPTILSIFDIDTPSTMNDTRLSATASEQSIDQRVDAMVDRNRRAIARDSAFGPVTVTFIVVIVIDILLAMVCLARLPKLAPTVRGLALVVLAVPPVCFLLGATSLATAPSMVVALIGLSLVVAGAAALTRRVDPSLPPLLLIGLLWGVLAIDIATGGNLQINTFFGYSPIVAGRFAGFGNQAFSMIAVTSLLLGSAYADRAGRKGSTLPNAATVGVIIWFFITVLLDGHPAMGSDVGGVLAFVPAATVSTLMYRGIKVNGRLMALIGVGTLAILAAFAAVDLQRPAVSRTHLGRFVQQFANGEAGEVIQRKIAANLRVLTSVWSWVIPAALVYFVYLTWRPNHTLQRLNQRHQNFRAFGVSALTLGVLAMALNDSGVSMPAVMLALVVTYVSYLVMELERPTGETETS